MASRLATKHVLRVRLAMLCVLGLFLFATPNAPSTAGSEGSGGRAVAHAPGGKALRSQKRVPSVQASRIDHGAGEPTLAITNDGNVFITTSDGCVTSCPGSEESLDTVRPGGRAVYMTSNDGKSWKDVTPNLGGLGTHVLSMDPYIHIDEATQRIFDIDLTVACSILSFTDDDGESWTTNPLACGEPVNDHQTLFTGPPVSSPTVGYENLVYYCFNHPGYTQCTKSLDGGLTFVRTASIAPPDCSGLNGHGVVDRKGTVYVPMGNCGPDLAISKDEGDTWEVVRVAEGTVSSGGDPSVAVDKKGNLYYLFENGERLPHLTVSRNGGKTWSKPIQVGAPGLKAANLSTVDVGDPGKVAIAYYGTTQQPSDSAFWSGYLAIGKNVLGKNPVFYSGTVNQPNKPLKVNGCGPGRCGRVLDFIDVEISRQGRAWGAYVDACLPDCEKAKQQDIHDNQAVVGRMVGGFRLR